MREIQSGAVYEPAAFGHFQEGTSLNNEFVEIETLFDSDGVSVTNGDYPVSSIWNGLVVCPRSAVITLSGTGIIPVSRISRAIIVNALRQTRGRR